MKAKRVVLMAVAALPLAAPLARPVPPARAGADSCAPAPLPGLDSLVAEGRYWHAWRALPALPRDRRPLGTSDALLRLRIAEGLQRWPEVDTVLARAQGVDTIPELLAGAARQAERSEHWATAAARYRRLESLPSARPVVRAAAAVRLAVAEERLALRDSAAAAWRRAAHALPDLADWFALQRAEFEADTAAAFASVAVVRSPGAAETADDFVARRRIEAGNMRGALELYLRRGRVLDAARVEVMLGKDDVARRRADALLADPSRPVALLAANFLVAQLGTPTPDELLGIARAFRARGDLLSAERYLRRATAPADAGVAAWLELASVAAARHR